MPSTVDLHYGADEPLRLEYDGDRFASFHAGPAPLADEAGALRAAFTSPIDFPPLASMCVPGDQVVLVVDPNLPSLSAVLGGVVEQLGSAGVEPDGITILQPARGLAAPVVDPRIGLATSLRQIVRWKRHDPDDTKSCGYLAASSSGERIYLARELLDADVVVPIFAAGFDSLVGYRSPGSLIYPGLSLSDAIQKSLGEGHPELRPDSDRPLRQLTDELCWLLGLQFAIGVAPSRAPGRASAVFAGQFEAVQRQTQQFLDRSWMLQLERRADVVVVSVSTDADRVTWEEIGSAISLAQNLVQREGRILVVSSLAASPGPGLELLQSSRSAKAALQRMRKELPPDLLSCTQVAAAAAWSHVSLLSRLDADLVEEMQLAPVSTPDEALRWIDQAEDVVLIDAGEHWWGEIVSS